MIRVARNILRKNWEFRTGNQSTRPIKTTEIPGGFRVENVNQSILLGYFHPIYGMPTNPFPVWVLMTLKCSISTSVCLTVTGAPSEFYFDLVAQEAAEVLMVDTVSGSATGRLLVNLRIEDLPIGEWLEITDPHFFLSTEKPDIWTLAHADLTPEQVALMKYGEFTEAKQI